MSVGASLSGGISGLLAEGAGRGREGGNAAGWDDGLDAEGAWSGSAAEGAHERSRGHFVCGGGVDGEVAVC